MKKRIVILSAFLSPLRSGAEACAEEVPLALQERYAFTIVTARMRRDLPKRDMLRGQIPVVRVGVGIAWLDKWMYPFLAPFAVRALKPDIVHAVLETFAGLALLFCRAPKTVLTCQTTNRSFLKKYIIRSPDTVTVISRVLADICSQAGRDDVVHIPNGIRLGMIRDAMHSIRKEPASLLFVGRLEKMKGIDTLLQASATEELLRTNAVIRIVGDGSERHALQALAAELGIADRVVFLGYLPSGEVEKEYARAEIFVGLSRSEALGNVFLEAQAAGCAVVATSVGGIPDIVTHEETGLLVAPDHPADAAKAIASLLSNDDLRRRIREACMAAAEGYDWGEIAEKYGEVYEG